MRTIGNAGKSSIAHDFFKKNDFLISEDENDHRAVVNQRTNIWKPIQQIFFLDREKVVHLIQNPTASAMDRPRRNADKNERLNVYIV